MSKITVFLHQQYDPQTAICKTNCTSQHGVQCVPKEFEETTVSGLKPSKTDECQNYQR